MACAVKLERTLYAMAVSRVTAGAACGSPHIATLLTKVWCPHGNHGAQHHALVRRPRSCNCPPGRGSRPHRGLARAPLPARSPWQWGGRSALAASCAQARRPSCTARLAAGHSEVGASAAGASPAACLARERSARHRSPVNPEPSHIHRYGPLTARFLNFARSTRRMAP